MDDDNSINPRVVEIPGPLKPVDELPKEVYSARIVELHKSTDRVCAIVWGSTVQSHLQRALISVLIKNDKHSAELTKFDGPLGNFRLMNDLAHAIGMYDDDVWSDVNIIRDVRNKFAHDVTILDSLHKHRSVSFNTDSIRDQTRNLKCPEIRMREHWTPETFRAWDVNGRAPEDVPTLEPPVDPRERFEWTCSSVEDLLNLVIWFDHLLVPSNTPRHYPRNNMYAGDFIRKQSS